MTGPIPIPGLAGVKPLGSSSTSSAPHLAAPAHQPATVKHPTTGKPATASWQTDYGTNYGQTLYDILNLPSNPVQNSATVFTSNISDQTAHLDRWGDPVNPAYGNRYGNQATTQTIGVQQTVSAGLEWLRDLSVNHKEEYNSWLVKLYDANYLSKNDLTFNVYTSKVAQAFVHAAYDTAAVNAKEDGSGAIVTLGDNLDAIAQGRAAAGLGAGASKQKPGNVDRYTDPDAVKEALRTSAQSILGRSLTDQEQAALVGKYHGIESAWNASQNAAAAQQAAGSDVSVTAQPNVTDSGAQMIRGQFSTEAAAQRAGQYMELMRSMFGGTIA